MNKSDTSQTPNTEASDQKQSDKSLAPNDVSASALTDIKHREVADMLLSSELTVSEACRLIIDALAMTYGVTSAAVALCMNDALLTLAATDDVMRVIDANDFNRQKTRLLQAAERHEWLRLIDVEDTSNNLWRIGREDDTVSEASPEMLVLAVGNRVRGGLIVQSTLSDKQREQVVGLCQAMMLSLEVLRLREESELRRKIIAQWQSFTEHIRFEEPEEAYQAVLKQSAELFAAERSSLLIYDEATDELTGRAATGPRAELARRARVRLGDGVAGAVLRDGQPLVVQDAAEEFGAETLHAERFYKTASFISLPIIVGDKRVAVINITDRADGAAYTELDVQLLQSLAPQIALAIDRAEWHERASQFRRLSITDSLTGLLNRRYLEERMAEEIERSKRTGAPMSFMMMDIDDFKLYNDRNGHQAGDLALELTAQNLKSALRAADTAARYGGEEFSVLLPQTSVEEARIIAERIRRRVERTRYPNSHLQPLGAVTVSIGISTFNENCQTLKAVIAHADQALYIAKHQGKNRVHLAASANS